MDTWKKILIIIASAAAVLVLGGICIYKFFVVPKYIEPVIISASTALRDADVQEVMIDLAQDLNDKGVIDNSTLRNYMNQAKKYVNSQNQTDLDFEEGDQDSISAGVEIDERIDTAKDNDTTSVSTSTSSLGIATIKVVGDTEQSNSSSVPKSEESYSQKFNISNEYADEEDDHDNSEESGMISDEEAKTIYNKIMAAMSSHEKNVFFSVIGKADTNKLMALYASSDKAEAKEYLMSILGEAEYEEALSIFYKYAPMLME